MSYFGDFGLEYDTGVQDFNQEKKRERTLPVISYGQTVEREHKGIQEAPKAHLLPLKCLNFNTVKTFPESGTIPITMIPSDNVVYY